MWQDWPMSCDQLAHDGQRGFDQRPHRRLRHRQREQLVRQHIARAVLGGGDEALELEHLEHAEQLAGGAAQALGNGGEIERRFFCGEQLDDVETFFQSRGAIATGADAAVLGGGAGSS